MPTKKEIADAEMTQAKPLALDYKEKAALTRAVELLRGAIAVCSPYAERIEPHGLHDAIDDAEELLRA